MPAPIDARKERARLADASTPTASARAKPWSTSAEPYRLWTAGRLEGQDAPRRTAIDGDGSKRTRASGATAGPTPWKPTRPAAPASTAQCAPGSSARVGGVGGGAAGGGLAGSAAGDA